jgi:hypothetical protein
MIYLEGLMHKKINIWIALLIIIILAASAAWAISAKAFWFSGISFGGFVISVTRSCTGDCSCNFCGCGDHSQIVFIPYGGDNFFVCPSLTFPYIGPFPQKGYRIIGWGINNKKGLIQIGTSP